MKIVYYPDRDRVGAVIQSDEPLLVLIGCDKKTMVVAPIDESLEHVILLKQIGRPETDIEKYFRVVLNRSGADWTFVCPLDYGRIASKEKRIERFYRDGFRIIPDALRKIGYNVPLEIPKRFRRPIHLLRNGDVSS